MTALRVRRLARATGLRCLRVARRHHFSLLSVGVLGGALAIVLTSSSFEVGEPGTAGVPAAAGVSPAMPPAAPASMKWPEAPHSRLVVYYVIDAEEQRQRIQTAVQADAGIQNGSPRPVTYRDFVWARTKQEEADARTFMNELAAIAQSQDYQFQVVDLR